MFIIAFWYIKHNCDFVKTNSQDLYINEINLFAWIFSKKFDVPMSEEIIWKWIRSGGRVYRVISNRKKGYLEVRDERGLIVVRKSDLSSDCIACAEKNFRNRGLIRLGRCDECSFGKASF